MSWTDWSINIPETAIPALLLLAALFLLIILYLYRLHSAVAQVMDLQVSHERRWQDLIEIFRTVDVRLKHLQSLHKEGWKNLQNVLSDTDMRDMRLRNEQNEQLVIDRKNANKRSDSDDWDQAIKALRALENGVGTAVRS